MADTAADVITQALVMHQSDRRSQSTVVICMCGAHVPAFGDRWQAHLADVTVAALTQAGLLGVQPVYRVAEPIPAGAVVTRSDITLEARWRAAALGVVAAWTHQPIAGVDVSGVQQEDVDARWPTLGAAIRRLVHAKAELLREKP